MRLFVQRSAFRTTAAMLTLAATIGYGLTSDTFQPKLQDNITLDIPIPLKPTSSGPVGLVKVSTHAFNDSVSLTGSINEELLRESAIDAGIVGEELVAFMAQMAHESGNFRWLTEKNPRIKAYANGKTAEALGNKGVADAKRFIGRGFIQITGRWNYEWMQRELKIDLTSSDKAAQRAADPAIAARIAVVYWIERVRPNVDNFTDVREVTKPINASMHALKKRIKKFVQFAVVFDAHHLAEEYM